LQFQAHCTGATYLPRVYVLTGFYNKIYSKLYKNTNHQKMHKESFIINCNTLLHVSTLLGHLQRELFCYRYSKVALCS
jgi:hypothetical protein